MNAYNSLVSSSNLHRVGIRNISDYSPFGVLLPERTVEGTFFRRGFSGKEKDDEIKREGNSYDFGARMMDSRVGKWLTLDPFSSKYPHLSSYVYCADMPISTFDPDGRLIIFVNGEVGSFGGTEKSKNNPNRASEKYWSKQFVSIIKGAFMDINVKYLDGDVGSSADSRYEQGYNRAKADFDKLIGQLEKNSDGKIIESLKLVSHSKGAAYSAGFQDAWNELATSKEHKDKFADDGGVVEFSLMLAAHQGRDFKVKSKETPTVNIHHQWDDLSWSNVGGNVLNVETDNNQWMWESTATHTIDGFHFEAFAVIDKFMENKNVKGRWSLKGVSNAAKGASKGFWNRSKQDYDDDN